MKAYVFTDKALARYAGQFVWLSLDVEKAENAAYRKKYGLNELPTFLVLDPKTEKVALRWVGGASVPQLVRILADATTTVKGRVPAGEAALALADKLYGEADYAKAAAAYREAIAKAPAGWPRYGRALESLLFSLYATKDYAGCARLALDAWPRLKKTTSAANVAASGLSCATEVPKEDPKRAELVAALAAASREILASPRADLAADDVSAVYETLAAEREDAKDEAGAKKILQERATFLEKAAAKAKTPDARAVFDSHRLGTYLELGEPERAVEHAPGLGARPAERLQPAGPPRGGLSGDEAVRRRARRVGPRAREGVRPAQDRDAPDPGRHLQGEGRSRVRAQDDRRGAAGRGVVTGGPAVRTDDRFAEEEARNALKEKGVRPKKRESERKRGSVRKRGQISDQERKRGQIYYLTPFRIDSKRLNKSVPF